MIQRAHALFSPHTLLGALVCLLALLTACSSGSEKEECINRFDCPDDLVCQNSTCVAPASNGTCVDDNGCPRGEICVTRQCRPTDGNSDNSSIPDMGDENNSNNSNNNTPVDMGTDDGTPPDIGNEDEPDDAEPPILTMSQPQTGQVDVPVNTNIVLTFNEPVRDIGIEFKVLLLDIDINSQVTMTGTVEGNVITLDPMEDLRPGAPYLITVTNEISDLAGNRLGDEIRWFFSTAITENTDHRELALKYAPVIHQEVDPDRGRADQFTNVNFDNNYILDDNFATYPDLDLKSSAYYIVLQTETHYFIQYLYYYPAYFDSNLEERFYPHDVTAVQVVVRKATEELPEQFLFSEGGYGIGGIFAVSLADQGVRERNQGNLVLEEPLENMWRDNHFRAYHGSSFHGHSYWNWAPGFQQLTYAPWSNHAEGTFNQPDHSIVYYPGQTSQGIVDLACDVEDDTACAPGLGITCQEGTCRDESNLRALSYNLTDFRSTLWVRRTDINETTRLFVSSRVAYDPHPNSGARPGDDEGRLFPVGFVSTEDNDRGALPYSWSTEGSVATGQWWLDPAYTLTARYRFLETPEGEAANTGVSLDYCFHPYFDIDRSAEEACQ